MIQEVKGRLVTALKTFVSKLMSFAKVPKFEIQKDVQNLIASGVFVVGIAILVWAIQIAAKDAFVWEKALSAIMFGSRAEESISLGVGLNLFHYVLIGSTFLFLGTIFFLRSNKVFSSLQQLVLAQIEKIKTKNLPNNPIKNTKSVGSKIKNTKSKTSNKFRQVTSKLGQNRAPLFQNAIRFKTKMATGISRIGHSVSVYTTQKRKQSIIISVVAASAILNVFFLTTISAQFFTKNNIYSYGTVQIQTQTAGLNTYRDSACTTKVSSLPWGNVSPGGSVSNYIYIKNEGDVPLTLTLDTTDWSPTNAANYISLNWNYNGQAVAPNQVVAIRLTLTVSQSINGIQNFDFQIVINGSG